ncbi:hypothetical protein [Streptomyces sp. NPDC102282]|uniref:hypothetical protein n=1 Tax=Streptomyces sp. NPDC102282 TaxID=3366154 RepID=UPI00380ED44C
MSGSADTGAGPDRSGRRAYGSLSAALLARADHGYARFLARAPEAVTDGGKGAAPAPKKYRGQAPH